MRYKTIQTPYINEKLTYGEIVSWDFRRLVQLRKATYGFIFSLEFSSGVEKSFQRSGYPNKKTAEAAKLRTIELLSTKKFIPYKIPVKDFYDYYLYVELLENRKIPYNSYMTYRNLINNYILPVLGNKYMCNVERNDILNVLSMISSSSILRSMNCFLTKSFELARKLHTTTLNPEPAIIANKKRISRDEKLGITEKHHAREHVILSLDEIMYFLNTAKQDEPDFFIIFLLAITCGLRISEAIGIKKSDILWEEKTLFVQRQLGRTTDTKGIESKNIVTQEKDPKTYKGTRKVPLADFVLDELVIAISKSNYDYLSCHPNGRPYTSNCARNHFRKVAEKCGFTGIIFHDLRTSYATQTAIGGVSIKAISECLGHAKTEFTKKVYIKDKRRIVYYPGDEFEKTTEDLLHDLTDIDIPTIDNDSVQDLLIL